MSKFTAVCRRATRKSLNGESDELCFSWQHGMELLAQTRGSEEALEGMILEKRPADFLELRHHRAPSAK